MNEIKYYAGIGSRQTPQSIQDLMVKIGRFLYFKGYTLRSGGAAGADTAFENAAGDKKEIFVPWHGYNDNESTLCDQPEEAFDIARKLHPRWDVCKDHVRKLHARNALIVCGPDMNTHVDFVVCWTLRGMMRGGTAMAIRIANFHDIPVFNLGIEEDKQKILDKLDVN